MKINLIMQYIKMVFPAILITPYFSYAGGMDRLVDIEVSNTIMTSDYPELHILLKNHSNRKIPFSLAFGISPGKKIQCEEKIENNRASFEGRYRIGNQHQYSISNGVIEEKKWTHRFFRIGAEGFLPPCTVPITLTIYEDDNNNTQIVRNIDVPEKLIPVISPTNDIDSLKLETDTMVEYYERLDQLLVRILIRNVSEVDSVLSITDRGLDCGINDTVFAKWDLIRSVKQGLESGPLYLESKNNWGVLIQSVRVLDLNKINDCTGWVEISTYNKDYDPVPFTKVKFNLKPNSTISYH